MRLAIKQGVELDAPAAPAESDDDEAAHGDEVRTPGVALAVAVANGQQQCVRLLLESGADVDAADADGDTALDFAVKHGHADVADFLRRRGAADRNAGRLSLSSSSNGGTSP